MTYEKYREETWSFAPTATVPIPEWYDGDMSRYLTTQVLGKDALGRSVIRGTIYEPFSTRTVDGQIVRDPFNGNIIPKPHISTVSTRVAGIMKQYYLPQVKQPDGQWALLNNAFTPDSGQPRFYQKQLSGKMDHNISDRQNDLTGDFCTSRTERLEDRNPRSGQPA